MTLIYKDNILPVIITCSRVFNTGSVLTPLDKNFWFVLVMMFKELVGNAWLLSF